MVDRTKAFDDQRLRRVLTLIQARVEDVAGLKVLDLACRIGHFSNALGDLGMNVLGVEGRTENLDKAAKESRSVSFVQNDVRRVDRARYGTFDITLCLGILYHLESLDAIRLCQNMFEMTERFAIIDTHVGSSGEDGSGYDGSTYDEYGALAPWSSIFNPTSFWFTEPALKDMLRDVGWASVEVIAGKSYPEEPDDRRWLVVSK